jgi:hypothetical protein
VFLSNVGERWEKNSPDISSYTFDFEAKIIEHVKACYWTLEAREIIPKYNKAGDGIMFICRNTK